MRQATAPPLLLLLMPPLLLWEPVLQQQVRWLLVTGPRQPARKARKVPVQVQVKVQVKERWVLAESLLQWRCHHRHCYCCQP